MKRQLIMYQNTLFPYYTQISDKVHDFSHTKNKKYFVCEKSCAFYRKRCIIEFIKNEACICFEIHIRGGDYLWKSLRARSQSVFLTALMFMPITFRVADATNHMFCKSEFSQTYSLVKCSNDRKECCHVYSAWLCLV